MSYFNVGYLICNILCRKRSSFFRLIFFKVLAFEKLKAVDWNRYFHGKVNSIEIKLVG